MKARTLRHLMLLSGKSIAIDVTDGETRERIFQICESLHVSRERQSPFQLQFTINGEEKRLTVADDLFIFHVRGDVPSRLHLTENRDIRKENWSQAIQLWAEILGIDQGIIQRSIAPIYQLPPGVPISVRVVQTAIFFLGLFGTFAFNSKMGLSLVPLLLLGFLAGIRIKSEYLIAVLIAAISIGGAGIQQASVGIMVFALIEAGTAIVTNRSVRLIALVVSFIGAIVFGNGLNFAHHSVGHYLAAALWCAFAVAMFPRNVSGDLSRTSLPLAVAVVIIAAPSNVWASLAALLVAIAPTVNWKKKNTVVTRETTTYVPVSVRKK